MNVLPSISYIGKTVQWYEIKLIVFLSVLLGTCFLNDLSCSIKLWTEIVCLSVLSLQFKFHKKKSLNDKQI